MVINSGIEIISNQVCFSLLDQRAKSRMSHLCLQHGIKLLAFGTIAGGFLTEKWLEKPEPDINNLGNWSLMKYKRFIDSSGGWDLFQELLHTVSNIAKKHNVSIANVACRHILDEPAVGGIIIGARLGESEHMDDNIRLFQFSLDQREKEEIATNLMKLEPIPGDCGDEYRKPPFLTASGDLSHHMESIPSPFKARMDEDGKIRVFSGTTWENIAGYCRAVRHGDHIYISGTIATHGQKLIGGNDPAAQLHFIIDKIEGVLHSLDANLKDVVRTRIFVQNIHDWEVIARVHGERFKDVWPTNTLVQSHLLGEEYLVEMEVEAIFSK
jgi:enamine deaminase RidA (YjgF/YER057c/UK114 family)